VDETPLGKELPERGRAGMAENCVLAAREHGRHPSAFLAEPKVADGVNTAMKAVQALGAYAARHTPAMNARALELSQGNDAVLVGRQACYDGVLASVATFCTHVGA
jgi:hypothetical protein